MPTALYIGENPLNQFSNGLIKKIDHGKSILGTGVIGGYIKNISCKVHEVVGTGIQIIPDLSDTETLRGKGEYSTRELLKDTHNTFGLLMQGLSVASDYLRQGKKVSVGLYKEDIRHKDFIKGVKGATDNGANALGLTLDISGDNYGSLSMSNVSKLSEISELGVGIGIEDFHERADGEIDIDSTLRIIKGKIKPKYVKISNITLNRLKSNNASKCVLRFYSGLIRMGIRIVEYYIGTIKKENTTYSIEQNEKSDTLINAATIEYEPMLTFKGEVWVEEMLVRFENGLRTDIGLDQLKELGNTQGLVTKMLRAAIEKAKKGKRISLNLYIKDLGSDNFIELVNKTTQFLPKEYRKNIIFEILEEKYGAINDQFIKHADALQKNGFSLAIDDLYVSEKTNGMSLEILDELLDVGIYPDYIKLDGKHSMAIRDNSINSTDLNKIITLIGQFALMKPTTIVAEWIQDMEHARKIGNLFLDIKGIKILYQGREINEGNFGEKSE